MNKIEIFVSFIGSRIPVVINHKKFTKPVEVYVKVPHFKNYHLKNYGKGKKDVEGGSKSTSQC